MNSTELEALRAFRQQVYRTFGCRRDALVALLEALLTAPSIETPAHLSLVPSCQRGWSSVYDAGYDSVQLSLALANEPVCLLVRLRSGGCFSADPTSQPPTGRRRRHGAKFVCDDPTTWPEPTDA